MDNNLLKYAKKLTTEKSEVARIIAAREKKEQKKKRAAEAREKNNQKERQRASEAAVEKERQIQSILMEFEAAAAPIVKSINELAEQTGSPFIAKGEKEKNSKTYTVKVYNPEDKGDVVSGYKIYFHVAGDVEVCRFHDNERERTAWFARCSREPELAWSGDIDLIDDERLYVKNICLFFGQGKVVTGKINANKLSRLVVKNLAADGLLNPPSPGA